MQSILIMIDERYAKALTLMVDGAGKHSRKQLIEDFLVDFCESNPTYLKMADELLNKASILDLKITAEKLRPVEPERPILERLISQLPVVEWMFQDYDGLIVRGMGRTPKEALSEALGREAVPDDWKDFNPEKTRMVV